MRVLHNYIIILLYKWISTGIGTYLVYAGTRNPIYINGLVSTINILPRSDDDMKPDRGGRSISKNILECY